MINDPKQIYNQDYQRVELYFSCKYLQIKDINSRIKLYKVLQTKNKHLIGKTEVVKKSFNPEYCHSFVVDFTFEKEQPFFAQILKVKRPNSKKEKEKVIGSVSFSLGEVFKSESNSSFFHIESEESTGYNGQILIRADRQHEQKNFEIILDFQVFNVPKPCIFSSLNTFVKISKRRFTAAQKNERREHDLKFEDIPSSEWLLVFKTDRVRRTRNPDFKEVRISKSKLCDNDFDLPLMFEVMKHRSDGNHLLIGQAFCKMSDLVVHKKQLSVPIEHSKKESMTILIKQFRKKEAFYFIDYLEGGLNITPCLGIDFSVSNKQKNNRRSLHTIVDSSKNHYLKCLTSIAHILKR